MRWIKNKSINLLIRLGFIVYTCIDIEEVYYGYESSDPDYSKVG